MRRKNRTSPIRNILKTLPVVFGVLAVFYVAMLIKETEVPTVLPVNEIHVEGELDFLDEKEIMKTVQNNITGSYMAVDLKRVREILLQQPWIKDVSLRRKWPADVSVIVEERKPIAYWNDDGYISEAGVVFKPSVIDKKLNLPRLNGPESQHDSVLKFMNILYKEMASLDYEVRRLDFDGRRAWKLVIASIASGEDGAIRNVINVKLGRFDTEKRLQRFIRILPALTAQADGAEDEIKVIDMRYPNGFAVQRLASDVTARLSIREASSRQNLRIDNLLINNLTMEHLNPKNITHDSVHVCRDAVVQMSEA